MVILELLGLSVVVGVVLGLGLRGYDTWREKRDKNYV